MNNKNNNNSTNTKVLSIVLDADYLIKEGGKLTLSSVSRQAIIDMWYVNTLGVICESL